MKRKIKKIGKKVILKKDDSNKTLEKNLGAAQRDVYLESNPHGFDSVNKIHKNKKKYSRKKKHKNNEY